jgi:hypothetical protein
MKKVLLLFFLIVSGFALANGIDVEAVYSFDEKYNYTIDLGTNDWKSLKTHQEKVEVSQIPDEILSKLTTTALLDSILDYPLLIDIYAFNTVDEGYINVFESFNGLHEFVERSNYTNTLANKYFSLKTEYKNGNIDVFLDMFFCKLLIDGMNLDIMILSSGDYVYTPNGSSVFVLTRGEELSWLERLLINYQMDSAYPNATRLGMATTNYNCHSYAWYYQSNSNIYWMNNPSAYMSDGSYSISTPSTGDKVFYTYADHSGVIYGVNPNNVQNPVTVTSKWGSCGLYQHYLNDCPYSGSVTVWD